ncbi:Retrovirus-related Pol polyprotein from transposon TNT 1-94 [Senna tora]|uniref:Retrovirus-related Pol polyprotein from transposon TNT 1-94 n=1 Tax=Senna tora TaxID=362788 RepID=A0A834XEC7_9FABA|nr:Retrovirus-related Pol polyprotein from transposon TNT 1-94 [Senna tora]
MATSPQSSSSSSTSQSTTVKLDSSNFLLWEPVVLSLIKGNKLTSHISGLVAPPPMLLPASEGGCGRNRGGRQGGFNSGGGRPFCYLCKKPGQVVFNCYYRFDKTFEPPKWQTPPLNHSNGFLNKSEQISDLKNNEAEIPILIIDRGALKLQHNSEVEDDVESSTGRN